MRSCKVTKAHDKRGSPSLVPTFTHFFFGGGFSYQNRLQTKVGSLILTSLLEDLA